MLRIALGLLFALSVPLPSSALTLGLKKGVAVRIDAHPAFALRDGLPPGALAARLREDPATGALHELWRVPSGWVWPEGAYEHDIVLVVLSGKVRVHAGTLVRDLGEGGTAVLPAGTRFEVRSRTWLRRPLLLVATNGRWAAQAPK
ncbi:MAG: hypothetical protein HY928_06440 [Elusimicrobia bacterium]|nr:hypothetical protein [Elusimicrobiota bacterium]